MILIIDNYDSFSYNLYQLIGTLNKNVRITRNDKTTIRQIEKDRPGCIVLSPGPGRPSEAGICIDIVKTFCSAIPILGVCLGHQAICEAFGGEVSHAENLVHGKASEIYIDTDCDIFKTMPKVIKGARYHSLTAVPDKLPAELNVTAKTKAGEIMAIAHKRYKVFGVQFHPESILTENGNLIVKNFLSL